MNRSLILGMAMAFFAGMQAAGAERILIPNEAWREGQRNSEYAVVYTSDLPDFLMYTNGRFFIHTYVPAELTVVSLPENGDGAIFRNAAGTASLRVSGSFLAVKRPLTVLRQWAVKRFGAECITYEDSGDGWFVLSGVKNRQVFYLKQWLGRVTQSSLEFFYPYEEKDHYDPMVPVLEAHFYQEDRGL